jgi:hypothetical protein
VNAQDERLFRLSQKGQDYIDWLAKATEYGSSLWSRCIPIAEDSLMDCEAAWKNPHEVKR